MARFAAGLLKKALRGKRPGPLLAALSGGRTPAPLLKVLAESGTDWSRAHFFMADERLVPAGSPDSNFGQARRLFFSKIRIPEANLHRVKGSAPGRAAAAYEKEIVKTAGPAGAFDIIFLGLGGDGHTASVFPGSPALSENKKLVLPVSAPGKIKPRQRITLTLKALNSAATVVLMASDRSKKPVFARAAAGDATIPAGRLRPRGKLYLLFSEKTELKRTRTP